MRPLVPFVCIVLTVSSLFVGTALARPPTAPQNIGSSADPANVTVWWDAPESNGGAEIEAYYLYRSADDAGFWFYANNSANETWFVDTNVTPGTNYSYYVEAVNAWGPGAASDITSVTMPPGPPSAPQNIDSTASATNVTVWWDAPASNGGAAIEQYWIYRAAENEAFGLYANVSAEETTFVDWDVLPGTSYSYYVEAVNAFGPGAPSNITSANVPQPPSAPLDLAASKVLGSIRLSWVEPADDGGAPIEGYDVYRAVGSAAPTLRGTSGPDEHAFNDATCPLLSTCHYWVAARNAAGQGAWSNEASALG